MQTYTPEHVEEITGIPAADLIEAARLYAGAERASILYCMGITQHTTGTDNVKSLANLAMLCGHIGMPGGGVNPLRGQNNVQGACDMGGLPDVFSGYQKVADAQARASAWRQAWGVTGLPATPGLKVTQMMPGGPCRRRLKALYIIGENPLVSDPDLEPRREEPAHPRLPGGPGYLPDRDRAAGRRGAALGLLRGKGRDLLQHRTPGAAGAQGGRAAGRGARGLADRLRHRRRAWAIP